MALAKSLEGIGVSFGKPASVVMLDLDVVSDVPDTFGVTRQRLGTLLCILARDVASQQNNAVPVRLDVDMLQAADMLEPKLRLHRGVNRGPVNVPFVLFAGAAVFGERRSSGE